MVLTIIFVIIAAALVVAVFYLIPTLIQIRRTFGQAEKFFETTRQQIAPLAHDLTVITQEVNNILRSVRRQVDKAEGAVTAVRDAAMRVKDFEEEIIHKIDEPLSEVATLLGGIGRGIGAFIRMVRR